MPANLPAPLWAGSSPHSANPGTSLAPHNGRADDTEWAVLDSTEPPRRITNRRKYSASIWPTRGWGTSAQPRTSHGIADHEWRCWPLHKNAMPELAHNTHEGEGVLKAKPVKSFRPAISGRRLGLDRWFSRYSSAVFHLGARRSRAN